VATATAPFEPPITIDVLEDIDMQISVFGSLQRLLRATDLTGPRYPPGSVN
jgi:hypothetical protein